VKKTIAPLLAAAGLCLASTSAFASNLDKLEQMKTTGTPMSAMAPVPQTGPKADAIRRNLQKIKLPPGFKISL
jgi:hypothetical protein